MRFFKTAYGYVSTVGSCDGVEISKDDFDLAMQSAKDSFCDIQPGPTAEERLDALETTTDDIILMMAEMIGGM